MIEIRRPVFVSGENPCLTLVDPETDRTTAVVSYWNVELSPWGLGHALVLWLEPGAAAPELGQGAIFTDNQPLARALVERLTQHFQEFRGMALLDLPIVEAECRQTFNGEHYRAVAQALDSLVEVEWEQILDRKQVNWPGFPAGEAAYDLTTVICPVGAGGLRLNGLAVGGTVQTVTSESGSPPASSAFMAFSETWIGPLEADKNAA
ncbi:MAG TPA: hypothetical protein PKW33_11145 [Anaerolineaceae bacterium]|nr:hypothetical protein [Anaerolineaceae bacterium]HPN52135.1 hypothetical protein [Anaerolineaceae bacterium]